MRKKPVIKSAVIKYNEIHAVVGELLPHLYSVLTNDEDFIDVRIKRQPDGTCLVVLKQYGGGGAPMVCFGSGYDPLGALVGVDGTVQAGKWRKDVPWSKPSE